MRRSIRDMILESVIANNGIKNVKLAIEVVRRLMPAVFEHSMYNEVLEELLQQKEIIELEFTGPDNPERIKSMFFIKGTKFLSLGEPIAHAEVSPMDRQSKIDV